MSARMSEGAAAYGGGPPWWRRPGGPPALTRLPWPSSLALAAVQLAGTYFAAREQGMQRLPLDPFAVLLLVAGPALLVERHRRPRLAALGTAAVALVYLGAGYPYGPVFLSVVVGCFTAVVAGQRYAAWAALAMLWTGHLLIGHWLYRWLPPSGDPPSDWGGELGIAAWMVAVLAVCELARMRREQWAREEAERKAAERRRAGEERLRIARELHDVLAHSISVINVRAGVGLALLDSDPGQARTALTTIRAVSKEALDEVRQLLDTLRAPGDAPRAPAPGLDRLPELADHAAQAGLRVETTTEGVRAPLPPGADLAAFRIVQEALTNVVRHSGSREARVRLGYRTGELEIRIDDDGPATGAGPAGGNGLVGMRERAAALGGTVRAGPRGDGGFRVLARLPLRTGRPSRPGTAQAPDEGSGEDPGGEAP